MRYFWLVAIVVCSVACGDGPKPDRYVDSGSSTDAGIRCQTTYGDKVCEGAKICFIPREHGIDKMQQCAAPCDPGIECDKWERQCTKIDEGWYCVGVTTGQSRRITDSNR